MDPKPNITPVGAAVDVTGTWHQGHASYPGRPAGLPLETGVLPPPRGGMGRQESAEAAVAGRNGEASSPTAGPSPSRPEAEERLMEMILSRENLMAA